MATQFKHSYKEFGAETVHKRVEDMLRKRDYAIEKGYTIDGDLDNFQVLEYGRLVKRF